MQRLPANRLVVHKGIALLAPFLNRCVGLGHQGLVAAALDERLQHRDQAGGAVLGAQEDGHVFGHAQPTHKGDTLGLGEPSRHALAFDSVHDWQGFLAHGDSV